MNDDLKRLLAQGFRWFDTLPSIERASEVGVTLAQDGFKVGYIISEERTQTVVYCKPQNTEPKPDYNPNSTTGA